jgi:uncharacterized membrane protein (DUF4010 family)
MNDLELATRFAVALGLGIFLGLERERTKQEGKAFAGVRTFALIALSGALAAFFQIRLDQPWIAAAAFLAIGALVVVSYVVTARQGDVGMTTEVSAILAFLLGMLCVHGELSLAASIGVATGLVLALRDWLHGLAHKIEGEDVEATLKFAIIALIVLPLVPDRNFGPPPLDVVNPYKIWLMIVLISGVDFASYLLVKIVGTEHGVGLTGLLGGLVSSTAVTLGFTRRSRGEPALCTPLGLGILLAWCVMFGRVFVLTGLLAPSLSPKLAVGLGLPAAAALASAYWLWRKSRTAERAKVETGANPFELSQAIKFGLLFGVVTFAAKAAYVHFGTRGLYIAGVIAGTTDVDPISLSMVDLALREPQSLDTAARTIEIAVLSNTLVKGGMVIVLGSPSIRRVMVPIVVFIVAASLAGILLF